MTQGVHSAGRSIPGPDANLPHFIYERMIHLNLNPTLTQLAELTGLQIRTLQRNLKGERAFKLSTAKQLADALDITIDDLVKAMPSIVE